MTGARFFFAVLFVLLTALASPATAATVKDAETAMAAGQHAAAVAMLRPLAEAGDADAQTLLGGLKGVGASKRSWVAPPTITALPDSRRGSSSFGPALRAGCRPGAARIGTLRA